MKGYKHLTEVQCQQVLAVYEKTRSVLQTVSAVGVSRNQVRYLLKKNGIRPSGARLGSVCYQHIEQVQEWAKAGLSLCEIGRRIGTTHNKVASFLKKHNFDKTPFHQRMENNPAWRGGRVVDEDGYILVKSPEHPNADRHGYVREHRLVMETHLGRLLDPNEVVHHKNKDKSDNRIENLEVYGDNADHLSEELKGIAPQWTDDGKKRLRESAEKRVKDGRRRKERCRHY